MQSLARHRAPELRLQNRFDVLEDESMELTCTDPSPENSQPAPSQTRTNNEDGPLTFDHTINDESLGASPSTAHMHVPGMDIHANLGKKRIRTTEPEISNLDVSEDTEHSLLCFSGKLAGKDAVFLVDSGSTHDFVSQNFVEKHHLETVSSGKEFSVTLADGSSTSQEFTMTTPIKMTLGNFGEKRSFKVFALSKYEAILGKPWLSQTNPVVDFRTNVMERRTIASQPPIPETGTSQDPPPVELNFISGKQARLELRKGEQGFQAWVSGADSKNNLESRRQYQSAILGFQLANKTAPQHLLNESFPPASPARSLRQRNHFKLPTPHTTLYQSSPIYFAARTFNELPKHLQSMKNLSEFKRRAQQHFLSYSCPCSKHPNRSA